MSIVMHDGRVRLYHGDSRDILKGIPDNSIDSCVCDPPYALVSIQKRFGKPGSAPAKGNDAYMRASAGFMGANWDVGETAFAETFWAEVLRVLKPGGHVVAFSGTRTYHRMAVAIEDAGFEIRDQCKWMHEDDSERDAFLASLNDEQRAQFVKLFEEHGAGQLSWDYGSGFPKSHDVSKGIDRIGGLPWGDFADLLDDLIKSSGHTYASLDRALGVKSSACYWVRKDARGGLPPRHHYERIKKILNPPVEFTDLYDKAEREVIAIEHRKNSPSGIVSAGRASVDVARKITAPATDAAREWQGWGTALKPAWEPICLARKPLCGTVAENVLKYGTGAINIDGSRVPGGNEHTLGRWPANICHDGSEEVLAAFPDGGAHGGKGNFVQHAWAGREATEQDIKRSTGSAARFFYCAKASRADRDAGLESVDGKRANSHPTVKPVSLCQWLCRLVTPPGGVILDPFMGSGSTGKAAVLEGFRFVGCEREDEYMPIAEARIKWAIGAVDRPAKAAVAPQQPAAANDNDLFSARAA